ncbi:MAG: type II toxin-antitoxin system PemK/MazF family toxin [Bacteroidota bacterium]
MESGEIWLVSFSPSVGDEIKKTRPAVIINNSELGALDLHIVVPITDSKKVVRDWHIKVTPTATNGLKKPSLVDCFQIHCFAEARFQKKIGVLAVKDLESVKVCLATVLDLL